LVNAWSQYEQVIVETYYAVKPGKTSLIHARPVRGQIFPQDWDVECSRPMRKLHPLGTKFLTHAKETNKEGGKPFLYNHYSWPYKIVP
jgi:hypothetical protein